MLLAHISQKKDTYATKSQLSIYSRIRHRTENRLKWLDFISLIMSSKLDFFAAKIFQPAEWADVPRRRPQKESSPGRLASPWPSPKLISADLLQATQGATPRDPGTWTHSAAANNVSRRHPTDLFCYSWDLELCSKAGWQSVGFSAKCKCRAPLCKKYYQFQDATMGH